MNFIYIIKKNKKILIKNISVSNKIKIKFIFSMSDCIEYIIYCNVYILKNINN